MPDTASIRLYSFSLSGHAHRARLMLTLLGVRAEIVEVDLKAGAHKRQEFLRINAFGQVPVLEDGTTVIADSNAILVYLALKFDSAGKWLPRDPMGAARVQRWLSVAAGQLAHGPAAARAATHFGVPLDVARARQIATGLFAVMELELTESDFLAAPHATIADIAIYSYTAHAPEGGVSLEPYPAIRAWLARIEALPGFTGMKRIGSAT